ncbi:MAG: transporter substrate-binding protein [Symbiobacteriaceae bacterium]|jgi:multiple sugar transport system substrate-binding protein|nr:transporter substrate-binding protein [Symbiobacteriaceae bacterium]
MRSLALFLTLLMLTACTSGGPKQKTALSDPVTLNLLVDPTDKTFDLAIEAFERTHGDIRIEKVTYSPGGASSVDQIRQEKLRSREVDILRVSLEQAQLAADDLILDLDPFIQKDRLDLSPYGGLIDGLRLEGKLYVLPIHATPTLIWYNAALFEAAGVPVPTPGWTWEEFRQASAKLTRGAGEERVWGVYDPFGIQEIAEMMIWQRAAGVPISPEAAREILSFWATMVDTDKSVLPLVPRVNGGTISATARAEGRVAIFSGLVYEYEGIYPPFTPPRPAGIPAPRWEAAPFPVYPGVRPAISAFPLSLAIAKESPHVDAAWEFLRFLATEEGSVAIVRAGRFPIVRTPAVQEAWFERSPTPPRSTAFVFEVEFMGQSFVPGDTTFLVNGAFREALGKVLQGGADWEGLYKEFLVKREAILKEG